MFNHILVPVDGSSTSWQAITRAVALTEAFRSRVTIIYVIDPYAFTGVGTDFAYGQAEYLTAAHTEAQQALDSATRAFSDRGLVVTASVVEGHAIYRGILETAESLDVDLIVMGSHGRRGLEKLVLGSVTAQVLSHAHMPVMVVRD